MANYLLEENTNWDTLKTDSILAVPEEKYIKVKQPVPVLIAYYTTWVNDDGRIQFREDIYEHDKQVAARLFLNTRGVDSPNKQKLASR
jgi:murein L,D-transpeptidase YcbB/YkuD